MLTPNASCTLYLHTVPGAYTRVYVPACFWQDGEDGVSIEVTDTESKKALLADKPLTIKRLVHCAFGGLPHCEVTTE